MTREEYKAERLKIEEQAKKQGRQLDSRCANENNPYKKGDIIEDRIGKAKILGWDVAAFKMSRYDMPELMYKCENINKDGSVSKRDPVRYIYQSNIRKLNH